MIKSKEATKKEIKKEALKRMKILKIDENVIKTFSKKSIIEVVNSSKSYSVEKALTIAREFEMDTYSKVYYVIVTEEKEFEISVYLLFVDINMLTWENDHTVIKNDIVNVYWYSSNANDKFSVCHDASYAYIYFKNENGVLKKEKLYEPEIN